MGQIVSPGTMQAERVRLRNLGQRVVMTNGVFDLLHTGHTRYLAQARALGDVLIVAVNDDASVSALKGATRPILPLAERVELMAALIMVDYVIAFSETTANAVVRVLQPDIYVKGGDYADGKPLPEAPVVLEYGGEVRLLPLTPSRSTSDIIRAIRAQKRLV